MSFAQNGHPSMSGHFHLVATDTAGNALYGWRNWRVGGRHFKVRLTDGTERDWDAWTKAGQTKPAAPPAGGRWAWDADMKEAFA